MKYLMDYGSNWPPRQRKRRIFDRYFWLNVSLVIGAFLIVAALAIIFDQRSRNIYFPSPTTSARPHNLNNPEGAQGGCLQRPLER